MHWTMTIDDAIPAPREPREGRFAGCTIAWDGRQPAKAVAVNISRHGMGGKGKIGLIVGKRVTVCIAGGEPMRGQVQWVRDDRFGIRFDDPIDTGRTRISEEAWSGKLAKAPAGSASGFELFRPPTSTWRPGFRVR